ncbi:hypothetical protein [Xanthomonas campestris]|uniref:hypothetical protein n=1 Tax=Xanthomonas campestris TaxID=339 RepID=UPI002B2266EB|nr:hypothetical protein [Xanthomonas campestris]MEA9559566.1 hypothetical protein [Xanthomonas campestris]MEA9721629.1 hypothetical protein [Xanthomonas campestris]MEB1882986.1 hypothetical protein [Xanthomonas campestris pv. campestris]
MSSSSLAAQDSKYLLSFAFDLAIQGILENGLSGIVEEETTTGALLGAMASHAPWAYVLGECDSSLIPYSWTHFSKSGSNSNSEAWVGADFALIFRVDDTNFRAAVFQAKRAKNLKGGFDTLQIAPAIDSWPPEPQILRLARFGSKAKYMAGNTCDWMHYLIYEENRVSCISIMDAERGLRAHLAGIADSSAKAMKVARGIYDLTGTHMTKSEVAKLWENSKSRFTPEKPAEDWIAMLRKGIESSSNHPIPGWLSLEGVNDAESFIQATSAYVDVYEGSPSKYGPTFKNSQSIAIKETVIQKIAKTLYNNPQVQAGVSSLLNNIKRK